MSMPQSSENALLRFRNISKVFNPASVNEVTLFSDFSLDLDENDFLSIVGSNGSGKTTLLNILCGNIPIDGGGVYLRDKNISGMTEFQRSAFIGRVFQDPAKGTCGSLTILENMALADNKGKSFGLRKGVGKIRVDYYRSQLELLKMGLENKIDLKVESLSGGQRQALALLISTMTPIDLLVLDEHTAALDPKSSETVMELTKTLVREKNLTTIMVTHNLRFAVEYGNRLLMMHEGASVLDLRGDEKKNCGIGDLLKVFNEISIECGN